MFGPHVRLGFANKPILGMRGLPDDEWNLRGRNETGNQNLHRWIAAFTDA